ncbi:hypothetical protein WME79_38110 [Sorangium sp. So ce726]|uniref:hypothetical protein n=1 Tax=Sorangium sp. So ce726 TaxID=3133319 RepID=UPI003F5E595E
MLFKQEFLTKIAAGQVTLAFRRWRRPTVKAGGTLKTPIGVLSIGEVSRIEEGQIGESDARRAGFPSREGLLEALRGDGEAGLYRIEFSLAGEDPRVLLRGQDALAPDDLALLRRRLERLDSASTRGPWTWAVLELIERKPAIRAGDLAPLLGQELLVFKRNVRKLKELGLTESLEVGYRLSARGRALRSAGRAMK